METLKVSYSILNAWSQGQYEQAVSYYLGRDFPATQQMELGRLKHKAIELHIAQNNCLPDYFGGGQLADPIIEKKREKVIRLSDTFSILLRGVPDCIDGTTLYEWKIGKTPALSYVDSLQMNYYKLLVPELTVGRYYCLNPYTDETTTAVKFLTKKGVDTAIEHVVTFGSEFFDYLKANKLFTNYTKGNDHA